jgi:hypothetical protein
MMQIARLLFAATVVSVFALILLFYSFGYSGNGGEYCGFDGRIDAREAASASFEEGDFHFLKVDMHSSMGRRLRIVPGVANCTVHPLGLQSNSRASATAPIHGPDSARLAQSFAGAFNLSMVRLLEEERLADCDVLLGM